MATHAVQKPHMAPAVIFGFILVLLVYLIFAGLSGKYVTMLPIPIIYSVWVVVSLIIFGRGLDKEAAADHSAQH